MALFDVIIVGGGPSGAMCGIKLQQLGYKTCIFEKNQFPRPKLCGGLLTQKTVDLLRKNCPSLNTFKLILNKTNEVTFFNKNKKTCTIKGQTPFYFTEREIFDHALITEYKNSGGLLVENTRIKIDNISIQDQTIKIDAQAFKYDMLIFADSCNTLYSKLTTQHRTDYFCLEGKSNKVKSAKNCNIYFNCIKNGYGWLFPKDEYYTIGLGGDNKQKTMKYAAKAFFENSGYDVCYTKGAFIPSGKPPKIDSSYNRIIPIGDALGLVDPITGEGIYYALYTGIQAAEAFHINKKNGSSHYVRLYVEQIKQTQKDLKCAYYLQKILFFPIITNTFLFLLKKHHNFACYYLDNVISLGKISYRKFILKYIRLKIVRLCNF